jgi:hypothetical protein
MKTLKKWWGELTTKSMSIKERFTEIIRARLNKQHPGTKKAKLLTALAVASTIAISLAVFVFTPLAVLPALVIGALPFGMVLSALIMYFFVLLPISIIITGVVGKIVFFALAPWYAKDFTPIKSLLEYPRELIATINFMVISLAAGVGVISVILINAVNKLVWLVEMVVSLPYELVQTHSLEGFTINMKAWFTSWKPVFFLEASLGDVIAKQFRMEQMAAEEAAKRPAKKQSKMAPVTPLPAT